MYFSSLKDLKGQEAAILSYIDPLVAILVSVSILGESINPVQILGGILILGFTLLNELKGKVLGAKSWCASRNWEFTIYNYKKLKVESRKQKVEENQTRISSSKGEFGSFSFCFLFYSSDEPTDQ